VSVKTGVVTIHKHHLTGNDPSIVYYVYSLTIWTKKSLLLILILLFVQRYILQLCIKTL